jgi:hypothetical protein
MELPLATREANMHLLFTVFDWSFHLFQMELPLSN